MNRYTYEHTDTFAGEANYCWINRGAVTMPDMTHYGYDGAQGYAKANASFERELVRRVKADLGFTGHPCRKESWGDTIALYPRGMCQVIFISFDESKNESEE